MIFLEKNKQAYLFIREVKEYVWPNSFSLSLKSYWIFYVNSSSIRFFLFCFFFEINSFGILSQKDVSDK